MEGEHLINKLFTDKLSAPSLEVGRDCPLDSATPSPSAYPAHASGSPMHIFVVTDPCSLAQSGSYQQDVRRHLDLGGSPSVLRHP